MVKAAAGQGRPSSQDVLLAYAWGAGEFTASDAMGAVGLTRSTTIEATDTLVALGLLRELPNAREAGEYRKGRPARRFELDESAAVLVGVDAGDVHLNVVVTDLRSAELARIRAGLGAEADDAATRARHISDSVDEALVAAGRTRAEVLALCLGVPAPVDASGRSPGHRAGFWARTNPGLIDVFDWCPIVRVDNDASLAAVAEGAVGAAAGCRNYIALLAGKRFGAGVVVDGHLLRGAHGGVGEMVAFDHVTGVGSADGLGAMISEWAGEARELGELGPRGALRGLPDGTIDAKQVLDAARGGDEDARRIVERAGARLARVVSVLGSMFDPGRVVVSGAIADGADQVVEAARAALPTDLDLPAPELVTSELGPEVVVVGAIAAASAAACASALDVWPRPTD